MLKDGMDAVDFELYDHDLKKVRLSELQGKVVLVFYPGAFTSVCEKELVLSETCLQNSTM